MSEVLPFLATPVPAATKTMQPTSTNTPTLTLTPPPSPTTTIVHFPTQDPLLPVGTAPPIEFDFSLGVGTATPKTPLPTFQPGAGFAFITVSDSKIFWGDCTPNKSTIVAQVDDVSEAKIVVIFNRVKSAAKEDFTPWSNGNIMYPSGDGHFTYVMKATELEGHNNYRRSWVYFQLVAVNLLWEEVGRTPVFTQSIYMEPCLCYEPLKGCPLETPKPKPKP